MAPHLISEGHRIGTPGSRARNCPVSIQPRARHQAGHQSATHHMPVVRRLEDVPVKTVRYPDLSSSQAGSTVLIASGGASGSRMDRQVQQRPLSGLAEVEVHPLAIGQDSPGRLDPAARSVRQ